MNIGKLKINKRMLIVKPELQKRIPERFRYEKLIHVDHGTISEILRRIRRIHPLISLPENYDYILTTAKNYMQIVNEIDQCFYDENSFQFLEYLLFVKEEDIVDTLDKSIGSHKYLTYNYPLVPSIIKLIKKLHPVSKRIYVYKHKEYIKNLREWFYEYYGKENVEFKVKEDRFRVTIKYGDFKIKNLSSSHLIQDFYLRIEFVLYKNSVLLDDIRGGRLSATKGEVSVNYAHSHLQGNYAFGRFGSFCRGASMVNAYMNGHFTDKEEFIDCMIHIDHLIKFEDVSNPFNRISRIKSGLAKYRLSGYAKRRIRSLATGGSKNILIANANVSYNTNGDLGYFTFDLKRYSGLRDSFFRSLSGTAALIFNTKEYDYNNYISSQESLSSDKEILTYKPNKGIIFKGKTPAFKVLNDTKETVPVGLKPVFANKAKTYLNSIIYNKLFNKVYVQRQEEHKEEQTA